MEHGDATCFLRTGYEVIGGTNGNRRGKVVASGALSADVSWDDGETETVDQFTHTLQVIDRGPPLPDFDPYDHLDDCDCPDCYGGSDYPWDGDGAED